MNKFQRKSQVLLIEDILTDTDKKQRIHLY